MIDILLMSGTAATLAAEDGEGAGRVYVRMAPSDIADDDEWRHDSRTRP